MSSGKTRRRTETETETETGTNQSTFDNEIKVITVNVNGYRSREGELRRYISEQGDNCVFALCDTRLNKYTPVKDILAYTMIRVDKESNSRMATAGGVALVIPKKWMSIEHKLKTKGNGFEALFATIIPPGGKAFKLLVTYNHPGNHFAPEIIKEYKEITFDNKPLPGLLVGDFNCPHSTFNSRTTNEYGSRFLQILNQENLIFFNNEAPTYFSNATGLANVLDLIIGERGTSPYVKSCVVEGDIGSDHLPVTSCLKFKPDTNKKQKVNMLLWAKSIDASLESLVVNDDINTTLTALMQIVADTKSNCIKTFKPSTRLLPEEIRDNIKLRKVILRNRKKATTDFARKILTKAHNRINKQIHKQIEEHDELELEKLTDAICNAEPNKMWQIFNQFKNKTKEIEKPGTPLKTPDNTLAVSNEQKCHEFARYLSTVHQTPDSPLFDNEFKRQIDHLINNEVRSTKGDTIPPINLDAFKQILQDTKRGSAPGEDSLSYDLMKLCSDKTKQTLCNIINKCLDQNTFPTLWKEAKVTMVPKPGRDPSYAANYRPISLLAAIGKVYEKYIHFYLIQELDAKSFMNPNQAGFTKGRSTQEHLLRLSQDISNGFKERNCTLGLFLDDKIPCGK